jgi:SagB-type dehydrogenase family enzyme
MTPSSKPIQLPKPRETGTMTVTESLRKRRSVRSYSDDPLTLNELSQLLWAGQGITGSEGNRTSPSAGGLYPIELYAVITYIDNLESGIYRYDPKNHTLVLLTAGDKRTELADAALQQECVMKSAASIVITADISKTSWKYGERAERYVFMESGHVSQNIHLQATSMNIGTVAVGAFFDDRVKAVLKLPANLHPLYIMPIGRT